MRAREVDVRGLEKRFGAHRVLRGLDLAVDGGALVHIIGANGSGKTTLLRIIATLTLPTAGKVRVCGLDAREDDVEVRRLVGFLSHQPFLYNELTVMENLLFYGRMFGIGEREASERAEGLLEELGASRWAGMPFGRLSRGMKQRAGIARAFLHAPRVLLMDEPFTGLDVEGAGALRDMLDGRVRKGTTVIMTSHDVRADLAAVTSVALLSGGRLEGPFDVGSGRAERLMMEHGRPPGRGGGVP